MPWSIPQIETDKTGRFTSKVHVCSINVFLWVSLNWISTAKIEIQLPSKWDLFHPKVDISMTSMNLASEASIFPPLTLKKPIGNNHGNSYILFIECQVTVYVYVNSTVDFEREKRWAAVEKLSFSPHWRDLFKSGIHSELQVQLSLPINLNCLSAPKWSLTCDKQKGKNSCFDRYAFLHDPRMWLASITARTHLMFKSFPWSLRSFPAELPPNQSVLSWNWNIWFLITHPVKPLANSLAW